MDFLNDCLRLIEIIGNSLANLVDFFVNFPNLIKSIISVLLNPLLGIVEVFISLIIIIIIAKVVKTFVG